MPSDGPLPPGARVVAYYRDSGHADQELSVAQQRRAAEPYCEQHHLVLLRAFSDEARLGGSVVGRKAFQEMIDYLHRLAPEPERGRALALAATPLRLCESFSRLASGRDIAPDATAAPPQPSPTPKSSEKSRRASHCSLLSYVARIR